MCLCLLLIWCISWMHLTIAGKEEKMWAKEEVLWKNFQRTRDLRSQTSEVVVWANLSSISIHIGYHQVWSASFPLVRNKESDALGRYASICVVVLNLRYPTQVMTSRKFMTGQPSESHKLLVFMKNLQKHRLGILIGTPDFLKSMAKEELEFLSESVGSSFISRASRNDPWLMVWETDHPVSVGNRVEKENITQTLAKTEDFLYHLENLNHLADAVFPTVKILGEIVIPTTSELPRTNSSVALSLYLPMASKVSRCSWYKQPSLDKHAQFCDTYEGYGSLCTCDGTYFPSKRNPPISIPMKENIPIVIVTANKPYHLYRLLRNLDFVWGAAETKVLVVVDGIQEEAISLTKLFGHDIRLHNPQGNSKDNTRANMNVGFSLWAVFDQYPDANKAIIVEDDLLLSPDFLSFFHQTSHLLDQDKTLSHINAFGQNSYPLTAANLSTVLRVEMYPQYGWLTTRQWFENVTLHWVREGKGIDWDWWLFNEGPKMGLYSIVPEVSRTGHAGSSGAHVSGFRQFYYFHTRVMSCASSQMPSINTERINPLQNYSDWMDEEIKSAKKLKLSDSPCNYNIFPTNETGPFVLYLGVGSRNDANSAFYLMQACLGTDETDVKEIFDGIMRLNVLPVSKSLVYGTQRHILYLVGCPLSSYCKYSTQIVDWIFPAPEMLENLPNIGFFRKHIRLRM